MHRVTCIKFCTPMKQGMERSFLLRDVSKFEVQSSFDDVINDTRRRHVLNNISAEPQLEVGTMGDFYMV